VSKPNQNKEEVLNDYFKRHRLRKQQISEIKFWSKNEILNSTTTFGGGIYSRTVKVYSFI